MQRRDLLLQQMSITQWQLVKPAILQGEAQLQIAAHIQMLILSQTPLKVTDPIIQDILLASEIKQENVLCLDFSQLPRIAVEHALLVCLFGQLSDIEGSLLLADKHTLWHCPPLELFSVTPKQKKQLWQHIQQFLSTKSNREIYAD